MDPAAARRVDCTRAPITVSDPVQTIVRKALPKAEFPVTAIAMAGSQNKPKQNHGLERMSRELAAVVQRFKTLSPLRPKRHLSLWSAIQRQPRLRFETRATWKWLREF